jgi:hypothetical protein
MSLHVAAQHLASKGRNGDTELVHMTKGEIQSLQGLALAGGGSLSINPDTGLVEASFLKRMLPTIAGIGLNMMFPGSGALIGLGVGGFEAARTGDIGKGLMAGLGAYGGAGIGSALAGAGASAANTAATESILAANQGNITGSEIAREMGTAGFNAPNAALTANPQLTGSEIAREMGTAGFNTPKVIDPNAMSMADKMGSGIKTIYNTPGAATTFAKDNLMNIGAAAAPMVADAMTPKGPEMPGAPEEEERYKTSPYRYNLASNFSGYTPARPNPYYRPSGLGYAEGGIADDEPMGDDMSMADGGIAAYAAGGGLKMKTMSLGDGIYKDSDDDTAGLGAYDAAMKRMEKQYAAANLKPTAMPKSGIAKLGQIKTAAAGGSIGGYSDGGRMLKGPGDGMSDSIPATIGKRQPARLADGEFVVPADVVSHLGNGSTDAGARKLYSMMDKVRHARTGKKKQAPAVKTDKFMPA